MTGTGAQILAVAGGGALGALCRYGMSMGFARLFPWAFNLATLVVNIIGSLLIGLLFVLLVEKMLLPGIFRQLLMVGFLGAFTTFSTFSLETLALLENGHIGAAIAYVLGSVLLSLAAVAGGVALGHQLAP